MTSAPETLPEEVVGLLSPFFPGFDLGSVRVYEGIPWYVMGDPLGYTDRHKIYFAPGAYRLDTHEGLALLAHEIAHCEQYRRLGTWRFRVQYLAGFARNLWRGKSRLQAYLDISFEIEARTVERRVWRALQRLEAQLLPESSPL